MPCGVPKPNSCPRRPPACSTYGDLQIARSDVVTLLLVVAVGAAADPVPAPDPARPRPPGAGQRHRRSPTGGGRPGHRQPRGLGAVVGARGGGHDAGAAPRPGQHLRGRPSTSPSPLPPQPSEGSGACPGRRWPEWSSASCRRCSKPRDLAIGGIGNLVAFLVLAAVLLPPARADRPADPRRGVQQRLGRQRPHDGPPQGGPDGRRRLPPHLGPPRRRWPR